MCRILLAMWPPQLASGIAACDVAIVAGIDGSTDNGDAERNPPGNRMRLAGQELIASPTIALDVHAAGAARSRDRTCPTKESL